eukprot:SAG11_NODE_561_length_8524_cov_17.539466_4_plen_408_part_00
MSADVVSHPAPSLGGMAAADGLHQQPQHVWAHADSPRLPGARGSYRQAAASDPRIISPQVLSRSLRGDTGLLSTRPQVYAAVYGRRNGGVAGRLPKSPRFRASSVKARQQPEWRPSSGRRAAAEEPTAQVPATCGVVPTRVSPPAEEPPSPEKTQEKDDTLQKWLRTKEKQKSNRARQLKRQRQQDVAFTARLQRRQQERAKLARQQERCNTIACELHAKVDALPGSAEHCENIVKLRAQIAEMVRSNHPESSPRYIPRTTSTRESLQEKESALQDLRDELDQMVAAQRRQAVQEKQQELTADEKDVESSIGIDSEPSKQAMRHGTGMDEVVSCYRNVKENIEWRKAVDPLGRYQRAMPSAQPINDSEVNEVGFRDKLALSQFSRSTVRGRCSLQPTVSSRRLSTKC